MEDRSNSSNLKIPQSYQTNPAPSNSGAVFPDLQQGYASFYQFTEASQALNLSPSGAQAPITLQPPLAHSSTPPLAHSSEPVTFPRPLVSQSQAQNAALACSPLTSPQQHAAPTMAHTLSSNLAPPKLTESRKSPIPLSLVSHAPPTKDDLKRLRQQMAALANNARSSPRPRIPSPAKPATAGVIGRHPTDLQIPRANSPAAVLIQPAHSKAKSKYPAILPTSAETQRKGVAGLPPPSAHGQSQVASSSPAIHAALNQPVVERGGKRPVMLQAERTVNSANVSPSPSIMSSSQLPFHTQQHPNSGKHPPPPHLQHHQQHHRQQQHKSAVPSQGNPAAYQPPPAWATSAAKHHHKSAPHKQPHKQSHKQPYKQPRQKKSTADVFKNTQLQTILPATKPTSNNPNTSTSASIPGMPPNIGNIPPAFYQQMSQLNSNIDPRKLIAAAAAVGNTTKLQNATAPPAQGSPAETQNEPKRTSGPKSIIESRLLRKRKKVYQEAVKNQLVSPVSRSTSGLPLSPHTTQSSAGGQVPQQKSVPNNNNITIGAQAKPAAAHLSSHAAGHALAVANPFLFGSAVSQPRFVEDRVPEFDWTLYLKHSKRKAVPHSAFKHVEVSLQNGFMIGMKVETPLRDMDCDKYWLATIVAVYGPLLKLRFDGYPDKTKDFFMKCSSGRLHPIGWCSRNQKSLLPPADIRHTQKQWKNFLLNALQGAKTVPTYLLSAHGGPWVADRIRQSMRLEVQHEKLPTAVWVAKVIRNVGGRLKLRYEGSIDDATDFWLFYLDRRIHPCGWAASNGYIYRPPDEIKDSFEYEVWSKILQDVTRDSSIDRIPSEIFQMHPELPAHTYHIGEVLETVHPTGAYVSPAKVSLIINDKYIILELLDTVGGVSRPITKCCDSRDPTLLPVGWCEKNNIPLGKPLKQGATDDSIPGFSWAHYFNIHKTSFPAKDTFLLDFRSPPHQFMIGQMLEANNPINPNQMCVAKVSKMLGRLMLLEIWISATGPSVLIMVSVNSLSLFPAGWSESNHFSLTAPKVDLTQQFNSLILKPSNVSDKTKGTNTDTIYFNTTCFTGPFLSKGRVQDLQPSIGPGPARQVAKDVVKAVINTGYKSSYVLKLLQKNPDTPKNTDMCEETIKAKYKGKTTEGIVEVCTKHSDIVSFCKQLCTTLNCCPNLISIRKLSNQCNEKCHLQTKTQFLSVEGRKPGRPSSTNPDGSKRKKRKSKKKPYKRRNLLAKSAEMGGADDSLIDDQSGAISENSSSDYDSQSPPPPLPQFDRGASRSPLRRISPTPRPRAAPDKEMTAGDHPLYQLQLASVKKSPSTVSGTSSVVPPPAVSASVSASVSSSQNSITSAQPAQYEVVKRKRGRPPNKAPDQTMKLPLGSQPTVPPLKIRKLDLSPTQLKKEFNPSALNGSMPPSKEPRRILPSPLTNGQPTASTSSRLIKQQSNTTLPKAQHSPSAGLLRAATPHSMFKSALTYSQPRLHIPEGEKVILTDNPLYWDVCRLIDFIKQTDCANLADKIANQEIDGQAFMLLVLPTAQEILDLKLGPALKLCHHVQRLKLAFYETYHPEEDMRRVRQED